MGKKGSTATSGPQMSVTIREASTGKKHTNAKSSLKLQHIKNLALWATRDVAIPSLGAFFGHHFAASSEALATPLDPFLFTCQRCETILHPGHNCTIRIEKNKKNARKKGKKASHYPQNNIVYTCHFCMHKNMKRGTPRHTNPPKPKPHPNPNTIVAPLGSTTNDPHRGKMGIFVEDNSVDITNGKKGIFVKNVPDPVTPTLTLESSVKKRNRSGAKKKVACDQNAEKTVNASSRKRRKSWTSLKEIAENNDNDFSPSANRVCSILGSLSHHPHHRNRNQPCKKSWSCNHLLLYPIKIDI